MRMLILLILIGAAFAEYIEVPAVDTNHNGVLVNLSVDILPGNGSVYVSIIPPVGEEFQRSIINSVNTAMSGDEVRKHDFFFRSSATNVTRSIDGPSAGVALGILVRSIRESKVLRHDLTLTGGLDADGSVIPVGGILEKAEVASRCGKKGMLVPPVTLDEKVGLEKLTRVQNISVAEYRNFDYAYYLFTHPDETVKTNITYPSVYFVDLNETNDEQFFNRSVGRMIDELSVELEKVRKDFPQAYKYFKDKYYLSRSLYEKGYTYSAGNEAFLSLYRLRLLSSNLSTTSIKRSLDDVHACLNRTKTNLDNYKGPVEYFANAELRYYWTEKEISSFTEPNSYYDRITYTMALNRALLWCTLAEDLSNYNGGNKVNTTHLKSIDESLIKNYLNGTITEHFVKAMDAYSKGYYGAALLELSMHESEVNSTYDDVLDGYLSNSTWVNMMIAHSNYLNATPEYGYDSSLSIKRYAFFSDMHMNDKTIYENKPVNEGINVQEFVLLMLIPICIAVVLLYRSFR